MGVDETDVTLAKVVAATVVVGEVTFAGAAVVVVAVVVLV